MRKHSPTSKIAYDSMKPHLTEMQERVIEALRKLPVGGTSYEISSAGNLENAQTHKRIPECIEKGLIFNTGITRPSPSGRKCSVYQIKQIPPPIKGELVQKELF